MARVLYAKTQLKIRNNKNLKSTNNTALRFGKLFRVTTGETLRAIIFVISFQI